MLTYNKLYQLKKHLINAVNKRISVTECTELIGISKSILIPYLINTKSSFLKLSNIHGMDLNDLAVEILGEVFQQNSKGNIIYLVNFASSLYSSIDAIKEENLFWAYQSFLRRMADVHTAVLYAEIDPNGFKIQRNIKETLPTETLDLKKNILGEIIFVKNFDQEDWCQYIDIEEFEKDFLIQTSGKFTTRELLNIVHSLLLGYDNFRKEISLTDLVRLFKKHYKVDEQILNDKELPDLLSIDSFINKFEIDQACSRILEKVKGKIFIDYFSKGKLVQEQARALVCAIEDIVDDLINTGKNHISYYDYLNKFIKIDRNEYEFRFKSKLEYLMKRVKDDLKNYIYTKK